MNNHNTKILWVIFLTIFLDMLGIGVLIPVIPLLILKTSPFNIIPINWSTSQALIMGGWLMATYPLLQFICAPILGQFSDKYGRRKILALSICGTAIAYLIFAYAIYTKNLPLMFIARAFDGATGGNISVAHAVIGDISEPSKRARNFGIVGMALGSGFILGPFFGGKLSDPDLVGWFTSDTPFIFTAILSILNVILILILLPETLQSGNNQAIDVKRPIHNIIRAFSDSELKNIIPAVFLFNAGFTFFTTFWGVILASRFSYSQGQVGNFFAYFGIMVILAQGGVVRRLSSKIDDYIVLRFSIIGSGLSILAYYFIPQNQTAWIYCIPPLMATCIALTKSFSTALITRVTKPEVRGEVMGVNSSSNALSGTLPALLAGYLATQYIMYPVLIGSICTTIGGLIFIYRFKPNNYNS
jgi:DHA1 family tetracycline resistance protein-like MFS transporter